MQYNWSPYAIGGATRPDSFTSMTPEMQQGLYSMLQAADQELGPGLQVYSGYRSPELQATLWENALKKYGSAEKARKWVAPPGRSRHNTGQAADLKFNGTRIDRLPEDHAARVWLHENTSRFGLDRPMSWEPWQVEQSGARGQAVAPRPAVPAQQFLPRPAPQPAEEAPTGIMAAIMDADSDEHQALGGLLSMMAPQQPAPIAPQIAPMQYQPLQVSRRDTAQPYLALFNQLLG